MAQSPAPSLIRRVASYCNALARIPTAVLRSLAQWTDRQLQDTLPNTRKWIGRSVFIADGSHGSMPARSN